MSGPRMIVGKKIHAAQAQRCCDFCRLAPSSTTTTLGDEVFQHCAPCKPGIEAIMDTFPHVDAILALRSLRAVTWAQRAADIVSVEKRASVEEDATP